MLGWDKSGQIANLIIAKVNEKDRELRSLRQQHSHQVQGLQQIIQSQTSRLTEKDQFITQNSQALRETDETIAELRQQTRQLQREKDVVVEEWERELR